MDPVVVHGGTSRLVCIRCTSTGPNVSPSVALWSSRRKTGHTYTPWLVSVSGQGGRVKEAPPLLLLLSGIIDLIRPLSDTDGTRGFFSFFCSIARVDGGSRGGRSTVVKVRAGWEGRGERGGQVEWSLFPRGMTRCEGLHRDRGYTPVRRCVGYVRVYIYTRRARATKRRRRRRRRDRGEFPRGFFCALRKFVWRVA